MKVARKILRQMALENDGKSGFDLATFSDRLGDENFNKAQRDMLDTRLNLLDSYLRIPLTDAAMANVKPKPQRSNSPKVEKREASAKERREWEVGQDRVRRAKIAKDNIWTFEPGTLTIIDLSCPFVDEESACAIFNICLSVFLQCATNVGRIIALDEAHKVGNIETT